MISFYKGNRWVELETFTVEDVVEYLNKELNKSFHKKRFEILATSIMRKVILTSIDGTNFVINANYATWIELSYNIQDRTKMTDVIDALKKWDKFTQTECKNMFDFDLEDKKTHITIFENGYVSVQDYKAHFYRYELAVTEF